MCPGVPACAGKLARFGHQKCPWNLLVARFIGFEGAKQLLKAVAMAVASGDGPPLVGA